MSRQVCPPRFSRKPCTERDRNSRGVILNYALNLPAQIVTKNVLRGGWVFHMKVGV